MKNRYRLMCYLSALICVVFSDNANLNTALFLKVKMPQFMLQNSPVSVNARSLIDCAHKCLSQKQSCFSFDEENHLCNIGNCNIDNSGAGLGRDFYVSCQDGFQLLTNGSVATCVWMSGNPLRYTDARDDCLAIGSYLYTVKALEKLWILQANYNVIRDAWIGINDMQTEGVYQWVDDNAICDTDCQQTIFKSGEPNNNDEQEDCGAFSAENRTLIDYICDERINYICEKPFFNFV